MMQNTETQPTVDQAQTCNTVILKSPNNQIQQLQQPHWCAIDNRKKCDHRSCRRRNPDVPMIKCSANNCERMLHWDCYKHLVIGRNNLEGQFDPINESPVEIKIACSKKHYDKVVSCIFRRKYIPMSMQRNVPWDKDGPSGPDDPMNSQAILLEWLLTPGNFARFKSSNKKGKTKKMVCQEISKQITERGIVKERTPTAILLKIEHFYASFKKADDWAENAGQGVLEKDGKTSFEEGARKICPFYFELVPIMKNIASSQAPNEVDHSTCGSSGAEDEGEHCCLKELEETDELGGNNMNEKVTTSTLACTVLNQDSTCTVLNQDSACTVLNQDLACAVLNQESACSVSNQDSAAMAGNSNTSPTKRKGVCEDNCQNNKRKKKNKYTKAKPRKSWEMMMFAKAKNEMAKSKWKQEVGGQNLNKRIEMLKQYKELKEKDYSDFVIQTICPEMAPIITAIKKEKNGKEEEEKDET